MMRAGGAVPLRGSGGGREVLLVHRPAYDDWSLPKGKPLDDEPLPVCAVREVEEETGTRVRLGACLTPTRHLVQGRRKQVDWWVGAPLTGDHSHSALLRPDRDQEVDRVEWLNRSAALDRMTYANERDVVVESLALPPTTALIILRHATAIPRAQWASNDQSRPLSPRGRQQLIFISGILRAFAVTRLQASTSARCLQTLAPYAGETATAIVPHRVLTEEEANPYDIRRYMADLAGVVGASGVPTVICGHRRVLPEMTAALGIGHTKLKTAACVVVHLDANGKVVAAESHDPASDRRERQAPESRQ